MLEEQVQTLKVVFSFDEDQRLLRLEYFPTIDPVGSMLWQRHFLCTHHPEYILCLDDKLVILLPFSSII